MPAAATVYDEDHVIIAGQFDLWTGDVGTAAPTTPIGPPDTPWEHAGYSTEDGTSFATTATFQQVRAHQSVYPVRRFKTEGTATANVTLEQWNKANFKTAFGGGSVETAGTFTKYVPPGPTEFTERAALLYIVDGALHYLWVIPRCGVSSGVTISMNKTANAGLPIALEVQGSANTDAFYLLTDDSAGFPVDA